MKITILEYSCSYLESGTKGGFTEKIPDKVTVTFLLDNTKVTLHDIPFTSINNIEQAIKTKIESWK